jgi:hypothetical protein
MARDDALLLSKFEYLANLSNFWIFSHKFGRCASDSVRYGEGFSSPSSNKIEQERFEQHTLTW